VELRAATPEDADTIAGIVFAALQHSYAELEPRRVALLELDDLRAEWAGRLRPDRDRSAGDDVGVVATEGDRLIGVAWWLIPRGPFDVEVADGVLTHLVVHPIAQNSGVGSALLPYAEDALRAVRGGREAQTARTRLHEGNWWAASFLEHRGWTREPDAEPGPGSTVSWSREL
jgi:GNAT superfamily N-acetyltransferase